VTILVGLGNPGPQYALTRHNIGFRFIDEVAENFSLGKFQQRGDSLWIKGDIISHPVYLLKPMRFMNCSGIPVREFINFYKFSIEDVIVIHDDLDLPLGKIKIKQGGSAGGHNGLKSLDTHLGSGYWRLRIGIGHPGHKDAVHAYVLKSFSSQEEEKLERLIQALMSEMQFLVKKDMARFLNNVSLHLQEV
jgi:PTH1 family peptidyl-tRNA hydrolase